MSLVPDDGQYAVATILGRKLRETSVVSTFKRPEQPIVLYEFEGRWTGPLHASCPGNLAALCHAEER